MLFPKFQYLRSKARLIACRLLPCQHCGKEDGTVVAAHSNQAIHGKGRSIKASDEFIAALCATCHYDIDQGSKLSQSEREKLWDEAYIKTKELLCQGQ